MVPDGAGQNHLFQIPTLAHQILDRIGVADPDDVLGNDRPGVEIRSHIVAGGADDFDPPLKGGVIGFGAGEGGEE